MSYRILTKNGVDNTNIDGARAEFFNSGMRDGIVRGAFTEGTFSSNASNSVYLDSCELRISGHRVVIDEPVYKTFSNTPASNTRYSMVAQISVDSVSVVTFSIIIQDANTELRKDNLYATETGTGIYQIEIGRFTLTTNGTIIDIVRTADLITGGGEDENTYIEIGEVTTTTLDEGIDAEVDVENVIDEQTGKKKTNFHFGIPSASGTVVNINGQHQETVNFDSEPQTQINELKSTNSTQGKDIDDLKNETLKKPASAPAKRKIVGINTSNSQELIDIDEAMSETSENPVQNKVVAKALSDLDDNKQDNLTAGNGINISNGVISTKNNDILSWKLVGQATGRTAISLSSLNGNYNEILIACGLVGVEENILDNQTIIIPKDRILTTDQIFSSGCYYNSAAYQACYYNVSSSRIALNNSAGNGKVVTTNTITYVYYR